MSNNNPHGHISQSVQNPSWNPLQIPSYIPRQPQLAHMSNERPMVRSPLTWHAPAPPSDAIYNFMSANHKNLEHQMNPVLPPYVRGPSPFDSMDLSVQSSRSSNSPISKSVLAHDYGHKQQQNQQMHAAGNYPGHMPTSSPSTISHTHSVSHTHAQHHQRQQTQHLITQAMQQNVAGTGVAGAMGTGAAAHPKYLNVNGNDDMLPPSLSIASANAATVGAAAGINSGEYLRDNETHMNENYTKISNMNRNYDNELQTKNLQKPVELVNKDCNYTMLSHKASHLQQPQVSPKKHSPLRNFHSNPQQQTQQQQPQYNSPHTASHNGPHTPPTPQSPVSQQQTSTTCSPASTTMNAGRMMQNSGLVDYNQLHLHHNNNYAPNIHHQQQLQQQHQTHLLTYDMHLDQHQNQQPTSLPQHQHQTTQQLESTHLHLTSLDSFNAQNEANKVKPLAAVAPMAKAPAPPARASVSHDDPTSNDDSLDSNSNSSRTRRKRKPNKLCRTTSHEGPELSVVATMQLQSPINRLANVKSPSPEHRKSPSKTLVSLSTGSRESATTQHRPEQTHYASTTNTAASAIRLSEASDCRQYDSQTTENGRNVTDPDTDVETIDKIAEMIAKTGTSSSNEVANSCSSSSSRCGGSPKTKKQRQALKLRSAEQNSNSHGSTNSYNESLPSAANDNAVIAEELRKELSEGAAECSVSQSADTKATSTAPIAGARPRTMSPQSNSRSCSSTSSSSSSCTNSSHSSGISKENKLKLNILDMSSKAASLENCAEIRTKAYDKQHALDCNAIRSSDPKERIIREDGKDPKDAVDDSKVSPLNVQRSPAKSCFEEVENKLEEMFAGIEDEPPPPASLDQSAASDAVSEVASDLSLALELSTVAAVNQIDVLLDQKSVAEEPASLPVTKPEKPPPTTKGAKKSTLPSPESTKTQARVTTPRRRLSVILNSSTTSKVDNQASDEKVMPAKALLDDQPSTSAAAAAAAISKPITTAKQISSGETKNSPKKKKGKANARKASVKSKGGASGLGKASKRTTLNKKQPKQKQKRKEQDSDDDDLPLREANGGGQVVVEPKYKSPYILVKPDGSISVINAPTAEDVAEKQTKAKKVPHGYAHDRKNIRGMHSSTLSNKYDADTADKTWICVFCKRGPHRMGLGDLFGPYLVSTDCEEYKTAVGAPGALDLDDVFANKRRRIDMVQRHPRNLPAVPAGGMDSLTNKKKKKTIEEAPPTVEPSLGQLAGFGSNAALDDFSGMIKISENTYEVWLHEDCAVWAPDVYLVGARVMGLDAAVWNSVRYHCVICANGGAMICCLQRGCNSAAHVPCARDRHWSLDESSFKIYCQAHVADSSTSNASTATTLLTATTSAAALATVMHKTPSSTTQSHI